MDKESETRNQRSFGASRISNEESGAPHGDGDGGSGRSRRPSGSALNVVDDVGDEGSVASSWAPRPASVGHQRTSVTSEPPRLSTPKKKQSTPAQQHQPQHEKKLQDQFMAGTIELLKLAGGVTLSTTGKLVAPPWHVARTVLLPAVWGGFVDHLNQSTPTRIKDWFRILSSSIHHLITVIAKTSRGKVFQKRLNNVGIDLVDSLSSTATRQALIDGMAAIVKLSEALHTPETKALLGQLSILACRMVDAAASGRNKQLLHDVSEAVWSGFELVSDPSTTLAMAEVTAYLVYALEMEEALHRKVLLPPRRAAQRRRERNVYQNQTYVGPSMTEDANTTVEQVILSSLGDAGEDGSFPSNVMLSQAVESATASEKDWLQREAEEGEGGLDWRERAGDDIDLPLLHERISARATELQRQQNAKRQEQEIPLETSFPQHTQEDLPTPQTRLKKPVVERDDGDIEEIVVTTVDEDDEDIEYVEENKGAKEPQDATPATTKLVGGELGYEDNHATETSDEDAIHEWLSEQFEADLPPVAPVDGESASGRFYRQLDEIMLKKREEAVSDILNREVPGAGLSWFPRAAAAAGAGNERGQDTIKNRLAAIRSTSRAGIGIGHAEAKERGIQSGMDGRQVSFVYFACRTIALTWFVLGCYGSYALLYTGERTVSSVSSSAKPQEVVVRIIREVVHVDSDGNILQEGKYRPFPATSADDLAACVSKAFE